jgi:hypothetical protein
MDCIVTLNPKSVLDVGVGFGKYGVLCREYLDLWDGREEYSQFLRRIDGVEVFADYITPLHKYVYDKVYTQDILLAADNLDFRYDLVLLIDVLEHLKKSDGELLLRKMSMRHRGVLISTPKKVSSQKNAFNNSYETHRSQWTKGDILRIGKTWFLADDQNFIAYLGKQEDVDNLKRKLFLNRTKKIPLMRSIIRMYLTIFRRYRRN